MKKNKWEIVIVLCVILLCVFFFCHRSVSDKDFEKGYTASFELEKMDIYDCIDLSGVVDAKEHKGVLVYEKGMMVGDVTVKKGEAVKKGDTICTLDIENINKRINYLTELNANNLYDTENTNDFEKDYMNFDSYDIKNELDKLGEWKRTPFIKAEYDGIILDVYVENGKVIENNLVADIGVGKKVTAYASDKQVLEIKRNMEAMIYSISNTQEYIWGNIYNMNPLKEEKGYGIEIDSADSDLLYIGTSVGVRVVTQMKKNVFAIPYFMLNEDSKGTFIIYKDGKREYVRKGLVTDYYVEVISDSLQMGQIIIMNDNG